MANKNNLPEEDLTWFRVGIKQCSQCLFSPNKIVDDRTKEEVLHRAVAEDTFFICHKASMVGEHICCRGFFDRYDPTIKQLAIRWDRIEYVDLDALDREI